MSVKSESRILDALLRVAPVLLLTLACAGVAQAQPVMPTAPPCTPPANRTYHVVNGAVKTIATGPADPSFPYIKSFPPTATWSVAPSSATPCDAGPVCVGLSVATLTGTANRTQYFSGTAVSGTQKLNVTAGACTAEFTFKADSIGGGWGEPDGGGDVGGQGGGTSTAGAGGEDMTTDAGGEGMTTNAGINGGGTAGVGDSAAGGAVSSDAAGQRATDVAGDAGASDAGAPSDASAADTTGCGCAVPAGTSGGVQAWLLLGVSVAFAARRHSPRS